MMLSLKNISYFLQKQMWDIDVYGCTRIEKVSLQFLRLLFVLVRDLTKGQLTMRAMSLVYTSLLSVVPLLAVSFSVLKAFGVHNQVEPLLQQFLAPLGEKGLELSDTIISFVDNMNVGVLGSVGLALLFYTVISLIAKIEDAFNHIWHITSARNFIQRFSYYLSVLLIGPVLVFSAMGLTASMMNAEVVQYIISFEPFGTIAYLVSYLLPYVFTIAAFTLVYILLPNTSVHIVPATIAACVAGLLWKGVGWVFTVFIVGSTKYDAIYSGFAIVIVLLIWLYINWLLLLLGAQLAFYLQHPEHIRPVRSISSLSNILKEKLALSVIYLIGVNHLQGGPSLSSDELVHRLSISSDLLAGIIDAMTSNNILTVTTDQPGTFVPARDLDSISLYDVLHAVRSTQQQQVLIGEKSPMFADVEHLLERLNQSIESEFANESVRQWLIKALNKNQALT